MNRTYSLQEANAVLKLVQVIAGEYVDRRTERRRLDRERDRLEAVETPEGMREELAGLDARIWEHDEVLRSCKKELEDLGMTVLRTNPLTIHIPGRTGRPGAGQAEVVFCWQEGEGSVCFGHPTGEEEHQRRPLRLAKGA